MVVALTSGRPGDVRIVRVDRTASSGGPIYDSFDHGHLAWMHRLATTTFGILGFLRPSPERAVGLPLVPSR